MGKPLGTIAGTIDNANNITDNGIYGLYKYPSSETNDIPEPGFGFIVISFVAVSHALQIAVKSGGGEEMFYRHKTKSQNWVDRSWMKIQTS